MKIFGMLLVAASLVVLMPACGNGGSKARTNSIAIAKAKVTVNEITKPVKTAKGIPARIFEVTPEGSAEASSVNMPADAETPKTNKCLVVVVGDASVPVEIIDARTAKIGGKEIRLDLIVIGPVVLVSAVRPANAVAASGISVEAVMKMIDSGKLDIPAADTLP